VRSGDIGDEVARSAEDADLPLDLAAVRADDDLIEALSAGLVPPPSGPRDPSDVEGELVALLAGWVADVRPESLLHPPRSQPATVQVMADAGPTDEDEPLAAVGSPAPVRSLLEFENAEPVAITRGRSSGARAYLLRAAAGLAAVALIGSGLVVRSYDAHPGDSLWVVAKVVFPEKSRSVEAATVVSTALNTARVALESGRIDEARAAFQTVQDQLAAVDDADGRAELAHQRDYLTTQLSASPHIAAQQVVATTAGPPPLATGQAGATIPSSPTVTPGATQVLLTPTASPSVLAAPSGDPAATAPGAGGSSPAAGSPAPAVVAAPAPDPAVSAPPAVSESAPSDAASGSSGSPPPVAAPPPAADPATNPPVATPSPEPPAPTSAPADPATTVQSTPDPPVDNVGSGGGSDTTQSAADNSPAVAPSEQSDSSAGSGGESAATSSDPSAANSSDSSGGGSGGGQESAKSSDGSGPTAAASAEISVDGLAGSTLGAVSGVVASTAGTS
jgi:hypothetical protein